MLRTAWQRNDSTYQPCRGNVRISVHVSYRRSRGTCMVENRAKELEWKAKRTRPLDSKTSNTGFEHSDRDFIHRTVLILSRQCSTTL